MILRAGPAHAEALAAIHADAFPAGEALSADSLARQLDLPGYFALIDARGGMLLARVAADEAEVLTLAVLHACRRRGVAEALLRGAMAQAAAAGAVALFLEVSDANLAAQALYVRVGFIQVGCRRRYYPDGSDALVLRTALSR
jgi:ribosomal-protein-alanine N-acetyltransferase